MNTTTTITPPIADNDNDFPKYSEMSAHDCWQIYGLEDLDPAEKVKLAEMLSGKSATAIASDTPSDIAKIAKTAEEIMMSLFGYESILNCVFESMPQCGPADVVDAADSIRTMARLIAQESAKLETQVIAPLEKLGA